MQPKLENQLIAALSPAESQQSLPLIELVDMPLGAVLYEPGITLRIRALAASIPA